MVHLFSLRTQIYRLRCCCFKGGLSRAVWLLVCFRHLVCELNSKTHQTVESFVAAPMLSRLDKSARTKPMVWAATTERELRDQRIICSTFDVLPASRTRALSALTLDFSTRSVARCYFNLCSFRPPGTYQILASTEDCSSIAVQLLVQVVQ